MAVVEGPAMQPPLSSVSASFCLLKSKGSSGVGSTHEVGSDDGTVQTKAEGAARLCPLLHVEGCLKSSRLSGAHSWEQLEGWWGGRRWKEVRRSLVSRRMKRSRVWLYLHRWRGNRKTKKKVY